jgi:cellobiose phosphorylase/cellobionic acid phosphorylase
MDQTTGTLWSPAWFPVNTELDSYQCRHGMKYTVITGRKDGVEIIWKTTVHPTEAVEIQRIEIRNRSGQPRKLLIVPLYQIDISFKDPYFFGSPDLFRTQLDTANGLMYIKNYSRHRDMERYALAWSGDKPILKYEMATERFLKGYSSLPRPNAILNDDWDNSAPDKLPPIFAPCYEIHLADGQDDTLNVKIFSAENFEQAQTKAARYAPADLYETSLAGHAKVTEKLLSENNLQTEDAPLNRFVNVWIKQQLHYTSYWNREEFGIGFRDSMQDCDSFCRHDYAQVRDRILQACRAIYEDGHTLRKWAAIDDKLYFDGCVWFINTVVHYLRESGDLALLDVQEPYFDGDPKKTDSVLGHMKRSVDFLAEKRGPDGLCRMGFGDWNDAMNGVDREGKGQSIWTSMAMIWAMRSFVPLLEYLGDPDAKKYQAFSDELKTILNEKCFEGDRYIRAITDAGLKVGSAECDEGKIYVNAQSWAMISRVADNDRAKVILKTVQEQLYTDYGPVLLAPVYTHNRPDIGRISSDPPGFVENGANYVHASMFHAYGLTLAGMPDNALNIIHRVLGENPRNPVSNSMLEPYMITNAYEGPASPHAGRSMFPWRTGSASWLLKVIWDGMVGVNPDFDDVKINASLPSAFGDCVTASRKIRGAKVHFTFVRNGATGEGKFDLTVANGAALNYEPLKDGTRVLVQL